jgi:hypothetical protein
MVAVAPAASYGANAAAAGTSDSLPLPLCDLCAKPADASDEECLLVSCTAKCHLPEVGRMGRRSQIAACVRMRSSCLVMHTRTRMRARARTCDPTLTLVIVVEHT